MVLPQITHILNVMQLAAASSTLGLLTQVTQTKLPVFHRLLCV